MRAIPLEHLNIYLAVQKKAVLLAKAKKNWEEKYDVAFRLYCETMELKKWAETKEFLKWRSLFEWFGMEPKEAIWQRKQRLFNLALNCVLSAIPMYELAHKEMYGNMEGYKPVVLYDRSHYITEFEERRQTTEVDTLMKRVEDLSQELAN